MTASSYRLARTFAPALYDISLYAAPRLDHFWGRVVVKGRLTGAQRSVEMHARGLELLEAHVDGGDEDAQQVTLQVHPERETWALSWPRALRGEVCLTIDYKGSLGRGMHGLYLATDGPEKALVSQCEATDARAIFPCLDEPDRKASLRWQICTDPELQVITNGKPQSTHRVPGRREIWHRFAPTRVIPTYLAAVTIGAFEASKVQTVQGIPCRVWSGRNKNAQTAFAQEVTAQVLPFYSAYFGHPYNYEKLDQVAVPGFDAGAMENVGAIFYRQTLLLMRAESVSWSGQKRIAEVIAHEIAHQWFGNLVTMRWWDDLWLNEAFATWMAYKACHAWKPQWRMWDDFLSSKQEAMAADARVSTHPIYTPVKTPAEATELFDVITYEKGCAVLRMVEHFMGEQAFARGIARYINAFKNANAEGADLWAKLGAESSAPVEQMMQSWINQPGFPLLQVTLEHQGGQTRMTLCQRRFFSDAKLAHGKHDAALWHVPVVVHYQKADGSIGEHRLTFSRAKDTFNLPDAAVGGWVYPNADATGFFRLQLDEKNLQALLKDGLPHLSPATRTALLEDQWALLLAGHIHVEQFLQVVLAYQGERDHIVVRALVGRLGSLQEAIVAPADHPALQHLVRALLVEQLAELGFAPQADEAPSRAVRRAQVVYALGELGRHPQVLQQAELLMLQEMQNPTSVEANLAGTVVALSALRGDTKMLDRYMAVYRSRKEAGEPPQLQMRYLGALPSFEKKGVITAILELCRTDGIPQEQLRSLLAPLLMRRASGEMTWAFLKKHWKALGPRVGGMGISRLVEATGALPPAYRRDVQAFFQAHPVPEAQRALQKALESMAQRDELRRRESGRAKAWLAQTVPTLRHGQLRPPTADIM